MLQNFTGIINYLKYIFIFFKSPSNDACVSINVDLPKDKPFGYPTCFA